MNDAMIDLGREYDGPVLANEKPGVPTYPSLYITGSAEDVPAKVGEEIYAVVVLKKKSASLNEDETGKKRYSCTFDVLAIKPLGDVGEEKEEEAEKSAIEAIHEDMMNGPQMDDEAEEDEYES